MSEEKAKAQEQEIENNAEETAAQEEPVENQTEQTETEAQDEPKQEAQDEKAEEPKQEAEPEKRIVEENIDYKDKYIRLSAEFDNYRKRTMKEKMDFIKSASATMLEKLLPVKDNFERAMKSMETAEDVAALTEGVTLIYNNFSDILKQSGLKEIEAMEQPFDVDVHEAITKIPAPTEELKGKVVDVVEKGYKLNDKVIRYAKVVVGE